MLVVVSEAFNPGTFSQLPANDGSLSLFVFAVVDGSIMTRGAFVMMEHFKKR